MGQGWTRRGSQVVGETACSKVSPWAPKGRGAAPVGPFGQSFCFEHVKSWETASFGSSITFNK